MPIINYLKYIVIREISGSLLEIYLAAYLAISGNILTALLYFTLQRVTVCVIRLGLAPFLWKFTNKYGLKITAICGLIFTTISVLFLNFDDVYISAILYGIGNAIYYPAYHAGLFNLIKDTNTPGKRTGNFVLCWITGSLIASIIVFSLTIFNLINLLPIILFGILLSSIIFIIPLNLGNYSLGNWPGYKTMFKALSKKCSLSNLDLDESFIHFGMTIVAISINPLLGIVTASGNVLGSVLTAILGGHLIDNNNHKGLILIVTFLLIISSLYIILPVSSFILLTALYGILYNPISMGRDVEIAKEMGQNRYLETLLFENMRGIGSVLSYGMLSLFFYYDILIWLPLVGILWIISTRIPFIIKKDD